jgi:hypothetical protein
VKNVGIDVLNVLDPSKLVLIVLEIVFLPQIVTVQPIIMMITPKMSSVTFVITNVSPVLTLLIIVISVDNTEKALQNVHVKLTDSN